MWQLSQYRTVDNMGYRKLAASHQGIQSRQLYCEVLFGIVLVAAAHVCRLAYGSLLGSPVLNDRPF